MGKLVYSMNVSLDGYVETPDHALDWADISEELHSWFNDQARQSSTFLYGRRMYELMAAAWSTAGDDPAATPAMVDFSTIWKPKPKVVFSSTLERVDWNARRVSGDVGERLAELRATYHGDLEVGGATLAAAFIRRGLVDAYRLVVHPVVLGAGTPYFPALESPLQLRLIDQRSFPGGVVGLDYEPA